MNWLTEKLYVLLAVIPADSVKIPKVQANQSQLNNLINGVFSIAGVIAVIFIIIGAYRYVTSQGDSNAVKTAKEMILYSIVGLILVIMAFSITQVVILVVNS